MLDFFVVIILILELSPGAHMENYSSIKIFRTLRLLRPLRSIQKVPRLRILVTTLSRSTMGLLNVNLFLFFIVSVFSILGVHQFSGAQYRRCRMIEVPCNGELPCDEWPINFDANKLCNNNEQWQSMLANAEVNVCG
jgi:hypothetical protein